jgi:hypothetical protein
LIYKLQRKDIDPFNVNSISSGEATRIQLVMMWIIYRLSRFSVYSFLIECDKGHAWNRNELADLAAYYKLFNIRRNLIEDTCLMRDNAVLMTSLNITHEAECYKLEMTISKTSIKDDTQRPRYIGLDRRV